MCSIYVSITCETNPAWDPNVWPQRSNGLPEIHVSETTVIAPHPFLDSTIILYYTAPFNTPYFSIAHYFYYLTPRPFFEELELLASAAVPAWWRPGETLHALRYDLGPSFGGMEAESGLAKGGP